jgi:hypothetical protein
MKDIDPSQSQFLEPRMALDSEETIGSITLACAAGFVAMASVLGIMLIV